MLIERIPLPHQHAHIDVTDLGCVVAEHRAEQLDALDVVQLVGICVDLRYPHKKTLQQPLPISA